MLITLQNIRRNMSRHIMIEKSSRKVFK